MSTWWGHKGTPEEGGEQERSANCSWQGRKDRRVEGWRSWERGREVRMLVPHQAFPFMWKAWPCEKAHRPGQGLCGLLSFPLVPETHSSQCTMLHDKLVGWEAGREYRCNRIGHVLINKAHNSCYFSLRSKTFLIKSGEDGSSRIKQQNKEGISKEATETKLPRAIHSLSQLPSGC